MASFEDSLSPVVWTEIPLSSVKKTSKPMESSETTSCMTNPSKSVFHRMPLTDVHCNTTLFTPNALFDTVDNKNVSAIVIETPVSTLVNINNESEVIDEEEIRKQKQQQELEESEKLAWELMQQESYAEYEMQVNFMRDNANDMSEEDRLALELILSQDANGTNRMNEENNQNEEEQEEQEEEEEEEADIDDMNYDQLLLLSEQIGDVYTEKWKRRCSKVIQTLSRLTYNQILQVCVMFIHIMYNYSLYVYVYI